MSAKLWDRFRTGQVLKGRLAKQWVEDSGAGAVLTAGARLGPWRIVELLGSGGMAHVYLAERADGQYEQQVALKLVRRNAKLIDRLRHERQIVATLRHPHIVSLVDGGETADGDLWFAMAVVDGLTIDQYAQTKALDWRARLQLFDAVCAAVEYAHGRALIHRDIKPANILVDAHGHPRLLDFGIALEGDGDGSDDHVLTPGFASPEQLAGQTIATTSDIYQLGLVLQTLLSGEVTLPGAARRDLQHLIARATAADPLARYPTAAALREDLANLQARRPLAADRDSTRIRLTRLVERHRLSVAVVAVAVVTLVVSLTIAALRLRDERNQAIANEQRANAVSGFLVSTLSQANPYAEQKGEISVLDAMDSAAKTLDATVGTTAELRRELRATIGNVYMNLDEAARCVDLLDSEQANADLSGAAGVERSRMMILRSECHLALDQRDAAWQWLEQAQGALANEQSVSADQLRAFIGVDRGQLLSLNGKLIEANAEFEHALALAVQSGSAEQEYRASRLLGNNVAIAGDDQRAVQLLTRALELARRTLGPTHRSTLTTTGNLATTQARLKQWTEAEATITGALTATQDIRHRGATPDIIIAQLRDDYANVLWQQGRLDECMQQSGQALAIYERMVSPNSSQGFNPSWRVAVCGYQAGQMDIAFAHAEKSLRFAQNGVPVGVINALRMLGAVSARRDQLRAAADYLKRADAALASTEVAGKSVYPALQLAHALLAIRSGDRAGAQAYLQQADASIAKAELKAAWLDQERADIAAMIAAAP